MSSENERLLRLLEVHGQAFLKSMDPDLNYPPSSHKRTSEEPDDDANEEEWHGINTHNLHQYSESGESEIGM